MTPIQVWEDCNPVAEPLSVDVVRTFEADGVVYEKIYFTVKKTEKGECRAYAISARPKKRSKYPTILIAPQASGVELDENLLKDIASDGYCAVAVDLEGEVENKKRYTFYPDDLDYCNLSRADRHLTYAEPSARETIWYNWTYVMRRSITLISELDYADAEKIILVGVGEGSLVAWQTAGMDGRLSGMVSVYGYNSEKNQDDEEQSQDEHDCWLSGVDQRSYAPFISIPVLHIGGTNTADGALEFIEKTADKMKGMGEFYADYGFGNEKSLTVKQINTVKEFIKKIFAGEKFAEKPTMEIETGIDGEFKIKINANGAKSAELWYAYLTDPEKVFWKRIDAGKKNGELIATFALNKKDEKVVVYAKAHYSKYSVVSRPKFVQTANVGVISQEKRFTRILFDGTTTRNLVPVVEDKVVYENTLEVKEGALGLSGISALDGGVSYVFDPEQPIDLWKASSLQFELFSLTDCTIEIKLYSGERIYKAEKRFRGGTGWQRVHLSASALKNEDMQKLSSFEEVWKIEMPKLYSALVRNVLLI